MKIKGKIKKWGNSLGLIIPAAIVNNLDLKANNNVSFTSDGNNFTVEPEEVIPTLDEILDSIPPDYRHPEDLQDFLKSQPVGRELI